MSYPPNIDANVTFTDGFPAILRPRKSAVFSRAVWEVKSLQNAVRDQWVGVEDLKVTSLQTNARAPASFSRAHDPVPSQSNDRFAFAPGAEALRVDWKVSGADFIYQMRFDLIANASTPGINPASLWTRTLTWNAGQCPPNGFIVFTGDLRQNPGLAPPPVTPEQIGVTTGNVITPHPLLATAFPEQFLTAEYSPYKLKVTIEDPHGTLHIIKPARWVYLDVLVERVELEWGPQATLANSPPLFNTGIERDRHVYNKLAVANDAENLHNALPAPGQTKRVYLNSNNFYTNVTEQNDNTQYDRHLAAWGFGPNIPIFVKTLFRKSDGQAVAAPAALGNARFLWDWQDVAPNVTAALDIPPQLMQEKRKLLIAQEEANNRRPPGDHFMNTILPAIAQAACELHLTGLLRDDLDYLENALDYKPVTGVPDYPNGNNCHEDRGGKRGPNHPNRIFPLQAGYAPAPALAANQFPFGVQAAIQRPWAAISQAWSGGDLQAAGKSGVIFSPSRMAGDAYTLRACLFYPSMPNRDQPDQTAAAYQAAYDGLPAQFKATTGRFEVWREVEIVHHVQKTNDLAGRKAVTQAVFDKYYDVACLKVRLTPLQTMTSPQWNTAFNAALLAAPPYIQAAIDPTVDQYADGPEGVLFRAHAAFRTKLETQAVAHGGLPGLFATYAPALNDVFTNNPLWHSNSYANDFDYGGGKASGIAWPRYLLMHLLERHFAAQDGVIVLEVGNATTLNISLRGFAVHYWAPHQNRALMVLCGDSPPETAAHELGHLLFLNHVHAQQGDRNRLHRHTNSGQGCVMSYSRGERQFCGSCQLRLRGWSLFEVNNTATGGTGANRTLWPIADHNRNPLPMGVVPALPPPNPPY